MDAGRARARRRRDRPRRGAARRRRTAPGASSSTASRAPCAQAEALDALLARRGPTLDAVVAVEVPRDELIRRLSGRLVCRRCGAMFHRELNPPAQARTLRPLRRRALPARGRPAREHRGPARALRPGDRPAGGVLSHGRSAAAGRGDGQPRAYLLH